MSAVDCPGLPVPSGDPPDDVAEALGAVRDLFRLLQQYAEDVAAQMAMIDALIDSHPDPAALLDAHRSAVLKLDALMTDKRIGLGTVQKCARFQARIAARLNGRTN